MKALVLAQTFMEWNPRNKVEGSKGTTKKENSEWRWSRL